MMASSTTMPMASDMPSRVKKLMVKPNKSMTMNVPSAEVGMESSTLKVELHEPRKAQQTRPVTSTESSTVSSVSPMACEVKRVPSKLTYMCRSGAVTASSALICVDEGAHVLADLDVVFAVLLLDADAERDLAVAPGEAADVGDAVLDAGDVAEMDVGVIYALAAPLRDEQIAHLLGRNRLAHRPHVELVLVVLEITGSRSRCSPS